MTATRSIHLDQFLPHPPSTVWRALTDPELIARWWAPCDLATTVGHRFHFEMPGWGVVPCTVVEVDEPRRLAYTFSDDALATTITWRLEPEGTGTRLFLEHAGFDPTDPMARTAFDNMGPGWADEVLPHLAELLDEVARDPRP